MIRLQADANGSHLAIRMENSTRDEKALARSAREARQGRGLGLSILTDIASRYHGNFQGSIEGGKYTALLTLCMEEGA